MDHIGTESIKEAYAQSLIDNDDYSRAMNIYAKEETEPVYEGLAFHPECELSKDLINNALSDISVDLLGLNKEMTYIADKYAYLISRIQLRLDAVQQKIEAEEDRIRDLNAIGGNYSQFSSVIAITDDNVSGSYYYRDKTFSGVPNGGTEKAISLSVVDVFGNGLEGNKNVKDAVGNTSKRSHLVDNDRVTQWEYCRYTHSSHVNNAPVRIYVDDEDARCSITFGSNTPFSAIKIQSAADIIVEDLLVSTNQGITYKSSMDHEIYLNRKDAKYNDPAYSYESGIIAFPTANYARLQLRSNGVTEDVLVDKREDSGDLTSTAVYTGVKRHVISVDNVIAYPAQYTSSAFQTKELISSPVESIAIFANEYVPSHFPEGTFVQYILTVNGVDHEVVPLNSQRNGYKIIRHSDYTVADAYVKHLNESIKSAILKVSIITTGNGATPYVSNLKVCLGRGSLD